ncbi:MAG: lipopolysaccharide transport system permease protein, partial [Comamonadaceae bacterium]
SVAGMLWALLHPLVMLAIYAVVFAYVFRVQVPHASSQQPYVLFVATALWPWLAFQEALVRGTTAVQAHAALVKKVAFPHELLVYSSVVASFVVHSIGLAVVLLTLRLLGYGISFWSWPIVIMGMTMLLLLATTFALLLGALQVFVKDVEQLLSQFMSVLFYATPILFPMSLVPTWLANVMQFNPLVHIIEFMRGAVLFTGGINWPQIASMWLLSVLAFYMARRFFLRLSPYFEDMV